MEVARWTLGGKYLGRGTADLICNSPGDQQAVHGGKGGVVDEVREEQGQVMQGSKVRETILAFTLSETEWH